MPSPLTLSQFKLVLARGDPRQLAQEFVFANVVHALPTSAAYDAFRQKVALHLPTSEHISIVGSGNWRYSLNPEKLLAEYHPNSDIDVAVVSSQLYHDTWNEMRSIQRARWYSLDFDSRQRLARRGQNVYSGFACPVWIPQTGHPTVYRFKSMLNKLSGPEIGHREVKMMYFKNNTEMLDYYCRGFIQAKRGLLT